MCLNANACLPDFEFFSVTDAQNLNQYQGFLGLTPDPNSTRLSFGQYLKDNKMIDHHIISIKQDLEGNGTLTFGGFNSSLADSTQPAWVDYKWVQFINGFKFWHFNTSKVGFSNLILSTDPVATIVHNSFPGILIWTKDPTLFYNLDILITKLLPTI